jgi:hypothetical protein
MGATCGGGSSDRAPSRVAPLESSPHHALTVSPATAEPNRLIDARDAQHDLSTSDIRRLVELVSHLQAAYGFSRRTALVVSTPMDFGMARMYGALAQKVDPDFSVFRDLGEAEAWLQGAR